MKIPRWLQDKFVQKLSIAGLTVVMIKKISKSNKLATGVVNFIREECPPADKMKKLIKRDPRRFSHGRSW